MNILALASLVICGSSLVFWVNIFIKTRSRQSVIWGLIMLGCSIGDILML